MSAILSSDEQDVRILFSRARRAAYELFVESRKRRLTNKEVTEAMLDIMDYAGMAWNGKTSAFDSLSWESRAYDG